MVYYIKTNMFKLLIVLVEFKKSYAIVQEWKINKLFCNL